ncbi:MAG: LPS-assembly protein LptD [Sulfitobacter sp.]|nr:LPS-assembly protein LptD [Sulfitobacter sp.]
MLRHLLILLLLVTPYALKAQETTGQPRPAVLVADKVFIEADRRLIAQGNVEAFQGETRLWARSITYDRATGALLIEGPIVLTEGTDQLLLADAAELSPDLREGLLLGARLVLNQQLQLAARQINRIDGRYSQLYKTSVTSCRICEDGRPPLWSIRAQRVVHDQFEQQLYFDHAQFRILRVPVFYVPRLRLPGPGLERATGFLVPSIRTTSQLGTGLKLPYFIKLGDHRDLTVTPYFSSATKTIELRYRQAFRRGRIEFNGAITRDDQRPDDTRGYLIGRGQFDLRRDFKLNFDIETVSDRAYFPDYRYYDQDRLESQISVSRARRDEFIRSSFYIFESLRDGESNETLPTIVLDGEYERRYFPTSALGGELRLSLQAHSHRRNSDLPFDGPDADTVVDGRDVARLTGRVNWLRRDTLRWGLVSDIQVGASFGAFDITQDNTFAQNHADIAPHAAIALRYPMIRRGQGGIVQMLEPVVQLAWTGGDRLDIPNEESSRPEFDEGNLLSLSRFPAADRRERGAVAAIGVNWARFDPQGWDAHLTVGQVLRREEDADFTNTSGLGGLRSDYLVAAQIRSFNGVSLTGRGLFDEDFDFAKAELSGDWRFDRGVLSGSYIWLDEDPSVSRDAATSEIFLAGSYELSKHWAAQADYRFDIEDDRSATAGIGLTYNNECVSVDLSVERRYSSSTSVEPTTNFGFNVGLRGFAVSTGTERYRRSCKF